MGIILIILNSTKTCYPSLKPVQEIEITIDVGGQIFKSHINTLTKFPESMLADMFNHQNLGMTRGSHYKMAPMAKKTDGIYFLDADPLHFKEILDYLRYGKIITQDANVLVGVKELSNFLGLTELVKELESREDDNFNLFSEMKVQWQTFLNFAKRITESIRELALAEAWRKKKERLGDF